MNLEIFSHSLHISAFCKDQAQFLNSICLMSTSSAACSYIKNGGCEEIINKIEEIGQLTLRHFLDLEFCHSQCE